MKRKNNYMPIIFFLFFFFPLCGESSSSILKEAHANVIQGEQTKNYLERQHSFNHALSLYQNLEQQHPSSTSLNQAIGDLYFQLNEYPLARVYHQRALKEPNSQNIHLLFGFLTLTFLIYSFSIWIPRSFIKKLALGSAILLVCLTSNTLFFYYTSPVEGILIKSTNVYRSPKWNDSQLKAAPILAGSKVQILQMTQDKNWLKIRDSDRVGYIPTDSLRTTLSGL